ncbi:polysaccharide deacetylase family protein [Arthrobacter celericrescens]|uniref:polysaccharide deacetylase family protein n=1 Tax=Arthrobacter celericrescens TaxID=2320851 RepID=UPI0013C4CA68|nr:polysaccharide deacetylase family protein [Arthrobacter celericrescens]
MTGPGSAHAAESPAPFPFVYNQTLLEAFIARRGGAIGTAGRAAVAFRCDHHLNRFKAELLPLHRKYAIPVTIAAMSQMTAVEKGPGGSELMPFPLLQKSALENGFEIANHSATHRDAASDLRLTEEIVESHWSLARSLPKLPIELFVPPGVGGTNYRGFDGGASWSSFQKHLAGRLITQQHALSTGYMPGYWSMTGQPLLNMGRSHIRIDDAAVAWRGKDFVKAARRQHKGVCFMYHPSALDAAGLAAVENLFAWCAAERDAGRLDILTVGGLMLARIDSPSRHDLLGGDEGFRNGWNGWNGSSAKWSLRAEQGGYYARRGAASTALSKDCPLGAYAGSTRQLRMSVRSGTGVRLKLEVFDVESPARFSTARTFTVRGSAAFSPLHQYVTLPMTGTQAVRVRLTPVSGGELLVQAPQLLAA